MTVCATEADDKQLSILVADNLKVWNNNVVNLSLTLASHQIVVLWIC